MFVQSTKYETIGQTKRNCGSRRMWGGKEPAPASDRDWGAEAEGKGRRAVL